MGIVRNLVIRFKNWYKDFVNGVVNNINAREITDDTKLRGNSKGKRPLAGLVALVLMATPVPGLTEDSKVEFTTETRIVEEIKDIPKIDKIDSLKEQIESCQTEQNDEINQYNTVAEYLESCENSKEGLSPLIKKSGISKIQCNDMLYILRAERCTQIRDELVNNGIISENFWDSYDNCMMGFIDLCDAARKKGDSDMLINVLPEEYREDYEEAFNIFIRTAIKSPLGKGKITPEVTEGLSDLSNILFADGERGGKLPQICTFFDRVLGTYGDLWAVPNAGNQANNPKSEVYKFVELRNNFRVNTDSIAEEFFTSEPISALVNAKKNK